MKPDRGQFSTFEAHDALFPAPVMMDNETPAAFDKRWADWSGHRTDAVVCNKEFQRENAKRAAAFKEQQQALKEMMIRDDERDSGSSKHTAYNRRWMHRDYENDTTYL